MLAACSWLHDRGRIRKPARVHEVRAPHGGAPVLPVLNDDVDGDVVVAIAVLNGGQLGRALIVVLRLEQAVGPLGKQRRRAGGGPVVRDHLIDGGAVEEVVVDQIARFGAEAVPGVAADVAGEVRGRIVVPEQPVTFVRDQDRDLDLGVGVEHAQRRPLAVDHAVLVLAETEQRFVGRRVERGGDGVGGDALDGRRGEALAVFRDERVVAQIRVADEAACSR